MNSAGQRCCKFWSMILVSNQAEMTRALAIGALTSSAAAACGLRGGDFFETYV